MKANWIVTLAITVFMQLPSLQFTILHSTIEPQTAKDPSSGHNKVELENSPEERVPNHPHRQLMIITALLHIVSLPFSAS